LFLLCTGFILCLFTINPTFIIIWLIVLSLLIGTTFFFLLNAWICYAVILLFTGGIIVLFSYMLSLIISSKINFISFTKLFIILWLLLITLWTSHSINFHYLTISNLFSETNNYLIITIALYLLLVLLRMVKLARSLNGPIKSFFTYEI